VVLVITLLVTGAAAFVFSTHMDEKAMRSMMQERIEKSGQKMTDEQVDKIMEYQKKFAPVTTVVGIVVVAAMYLLIALVFFLLFKLLDADFSFKQSFSVALHGSVPNLISGLLGIGLVLKTGAIDPRDAGNLVMSNLGFLADAETQKALHGLLSSIDLFSIWTVILLTMGYGILSNRSFKQTAPFTFGLWAVYVIGKVGISLVIPS